MNEITYEVPTVNSEGKVIGTSRIIGDQFGEYQVVCTIDKGCFEELQKKVGWGIHISSRQVEKKNTLIFPEDMKGVPSIFGGFK